MSELERQAVEELLNEAKRGKERAQTMGAYGWQTKKATTNKRFLHNTMMSTLRDYTRSSKSHQGDPGTHPGPTKRPKWSPPEPRRDGAPHRGSRPGSASPAVDGGPTDEPLLRRRGDGVLGRPGVGGMPLGGPYRTSSREGRSPGSCDQRDASPAAGTARARPARSEAPTRDPRNVHGRRRHGNGESSSGSEDVKKARRGESPASHKATTKEAL